MVELIVIGAALVVKSPSTFFPSTFACNKVCRIISISSVVVGVALFSSSALMLLLAVVAVVVDVVLSSFSGEVKFRCRLKFSSSFLRSIVAVVVVAAIVVVVVTLER